MGRIHLLDDRLISKIAAGEVVERPASVVKELVENALDAESTEIRLDLEAGGKRRILIVDNGKGMDRDDALLAFDRHATSKIADFDDLERVNTLGFRGEALATIAAVSRVELITAETPGDGHRVRIEGGRVKSVEPAPHPRGTRFEIASLFFNVPARRKFLKRPQTELRRCVEVVQGYALAHPQVRFTLRHEGRGLLETLPVEPDEGGLAERIGQVFGRSLSRNLIPIPDGFEDGEELITGFVGNRETARGRRLFIYVNRRLVRDRAVLAGFYKAVRQEWKSEDFPALFLFLDVPPEEVDVNVHPQKAEVRFRDPGFVDRAIEAIRGGLIAARGEEPAPLRVPSSLPTAPAVWEGLGSKRMPDLRGGGPWSASEVQQPRTDYRAEPRARFEFDASAPSGTPAVDGVLGDQPPSEGALPPGTDGSALHGPGEHGPGEHGPGEHGPGEHGLGEHGLGEHGLGEHGLGEHGLGEHSPGEQHAAPNHPGRHRPVQHIAQPSVQPLPRRTPIPLSGRSGRERPFRLIGQYKGTLILLEGPDGLYVIDQHVAHERILYERLRQAMEEERPSSQTLLIPPLLELSASEAMRLTELTPALEECGFLLNPLSGNEIALTATPVSLSIDQSEALLRQLASSPSDTDQDVRALRRRLLDDLAASLACRAAIKMHHPLTAEAMEAVVSELFSAEQPYSCPHGRPTVLQMTDIELERRFGRR